jgi:hypothetical protein
LAVSTFHSSSTVAKLMNSPTYSPRKAAASCFGASWIEEGHVEHPAELAFDAPVLANHLVQSCCIGLESRDATEIEAREKPQSPPMVPVASEPEKPQRKRGRRKKNEPPPLPEPTRLEQPAVLAKQDSMTMEQMLEGLPLACNVGSKCRSERHLHARR